MGLQNNQQNAAAQNSASQFNAGMGLDAFQANQQARQNQLGQLLQYYQLLGGLGQGQQGQAAALLGLLAGQPIPQQQPNALGNTLGDLGQGLALLPYLQGLTNQKASG